MQLAAVTAFDEDPLHAPGLEDATKPLQLLKIGEDLGPLVVGQRLDGLDIIQQLGWIIRVPEERIERGVVVRHSSHGKPSCAGWRNTGGTFCAGSA